MTAKYSITIYCPSDGEYIAEHMREMDVFECRAAGFKTPLEAINESVKASAQAWTFCYGGIPLCVFGDVSDKCGGAVISNTTLRKWRVIQPVESFSNHVQELLLPPIGK